MENITTVNPKLYFSTADRQMETYLRNDKREAMEQFKRELVYGIMFKGNFVITDIFIFISHYFAALVIDDFYTRRFIVESIRQKAIIPSFRPKDKKNTLYTSGKEILEIFNVLNKNNILGMQDRAYKVCQFLHEGLAGQPLYKEMWPDESIGDSYKKMIERTFVGERDTTKYSQEFQEFWESCKSIRESVMGNLKISRGTSGEDQGFRRAGCYGQLNKYINGGDEEEIGDNREIWTKLYDKPALQKVVKKIIKCVDYTYQYNQSTMLRLDPSLSAVDPVDMDFIHLLGNLKFNNNVNSENDLDSKLFSGPTVDELIEIDPIYLFQVRQNEGNKYFQALKNWHNSRSAVTKEELFSKFKSYLNSLNIVVGEHKKYLHLHPKNRERLETFESVGEKILEKTLPQVAEEICNVFLQISFAKIILCIIPPKAKHTPLEPFLPFVQKMILTAFD